MKTERFGRLTVIAQLAPKVWKGGDKTRKDARVLAACDCGTERVVYLKHLKSGASQSCGCYSRERAAQRRGTANPLYTHGMTGTPTYRTWRAMIFRCLNENAANWKYYGALGVTVCEDWLSFEAFLGDMGVRPEGRTLDRIDTYGNYEPGNCRWATPKEQRANQRQPA